LRLRIKTLVIVSAVMAVLFVGLFFSVRAVILRDFRHLELDAATVDVERVTHAIFDEVWHLERICSDIAPRNDTYRFMQGLAPDYATAKLNERALCSLGADVMFFLDEDGALVHEEAVDLDLEIREPMDPAVRDVVLGADYLRSPGDPRGEESGIVRLTDGVMFVAAHAITTSDMYSPPVGTLVLGRFLDDAEVERLCYMTRLSVAAFPVSGCILPDDVQEALDEMDGDGDSWLDPIDSETMGAYALVRDVEGSPAVVLRVDLPREILHRGESAVFYLAISMLLAGIAATMTVFVVIDHGMLRRLDRLSRELAGLRRVKDASARVSVLGRDELSDLADDINSTLAVIEESEEELMAMRDELEVRVEERTEELSASERRFRDLIESMADAVFTLDLDGRITLANECAEKFAGRTSEELIGIPFTDLVSSHEEYEFARYVSGDMERDHTATMEAQLSGAGGDLVPLELRVAPLVDELENICGTQWIARDIAERKRFERKLVYLANHDYLTGLNNRRFFKSALEFELASTRRTDAKGALVCLDIDDFKDVNDSLGHQVGDDVLVALGEILRRNVRESNVLARLGGDEFAVLVPGAGREEGEAAAERILAAINSHIFAVSGHSVHISASAGLVMYPEHGVTSADLLANVDIAMYHAKDSGRSQMSVAQLDETRRSAVRSRLMWTERLAAALDEGRFRAYAQPILDTRSGKIVRFEMLVRLIGEDGRTVLPSEFLPAAERTGLIRDIDKWMIARAAEILVAHAADDVSLDVNLSGQSFADPELLFVIEEALHSSQVDPRRLGLEITETAAIADFARALDFINVVKGLGCRISLDDFGSGFSSFYYLKHMPFDCLKIDGSFIRDLPHSRQDQHLVHAMVEMCRGLGVDVAAEYVETEEVFKSVEDLSIDYAQGYWIDRPMLIEEAITAHVEALGRESE